MSPKHIFFPANQLIRAEEVRVATPVESKDGEALSPNAT